jgi:transcriptional regulator with XRE-family HTH domain
MNASNVSVGELLRGWRQRRRMSQLDLACSSEISQRHLSFLESGRSMPSREMILRLARHLEIPTRERNVLLTAAGFAPVYRERPLSDPALTSARNAVELVLKGYAPFPALAVDRHWSLLAANEAVSLFLVGVDAQLLAPPLNVLRVSLHPDGIAPRIENLAEWRDHVLARLRHQISVSGDAVLSGLYDELAAYPAPRRRVRTSDHESVAIPLRLRSDAGVLSFLSTTTVFGTPVDITLSELAIEAFLPADTATGEALRALAREEQRSRAAG